MLPPQDSLPLVDLRPLPLATGLARLRLLPGTLARLGPVALARYARHRLRGAGALPADAPLPEPPFLHPASSGGGSVDWFGPVPEALRGVGASGVPTAGTFDIRLVWEAGRLVDLPLLAARDPAAAEAMVRSFVRENPPFRGPHWACGQEASIRLAHLLAAHRAIGGAMLPGLRALVGAHRERILATLDYAMAQDNNHATSEAAGLWLAGMALADEAAERRGRALLERAVARLFLAGGAFSQQAMRYQLVALEMPAFALEEARRRGRPVLSAEALARLREGAGWLCRITHPSCGHAWRLGPDDGSRFFGAPRDDLRPALGRALAAFGPWPGHDAPRGGARAWLDEEGGVAGLEMGSVRAFLRLPVHRFRPGQADALHLEFWDREDCLLTDGGSALYNASADPDAPDLARTAAHNTISFDGDDQMPRLSRFLYGAWLRPTELAAEPGRMLGAYRDWKGRWHRREARLGDAGLTIEDRFGGPFTRATARFRLAAGDWRLDGARLLGAGLAIAAEGASRLRLVRLPFAPTYGRWTTTPALEATADRPGRLLFTITVARQSHSA